MHIIEIITGRVMKTYSFPAVIQQIRWNPSPLLSDVLAVVCESTVFFLDTEMSGNEEIHQRCQDLLHSHRKVGVNGEYERKESDPEEVRGVTWLVNEGTEDDSFVSKDVVIVMKHVNPVKDIAWHSKYVDGRIDKE